MSLKSTVKTEDSSMSGVAPSTLNSNDIAHCQRKVSKKNFEELKNIKNRFAKRKFLFNRRRLICDLCVVMAMVGIIFMIASTELSIFKMENKESNVHKLSYLFKWIVSISTVFLLLLLIWFHRTDLCIFMIDNGMDDWRLSMTLPRVLLVCLEIIICVIHPFPGNHNVKLTNVLRTSSKKQMTYTEENILPIEVLMSLPMFLRFFLVCRALMLHSHINQNVCAQSLGAINKIQFNFSFIFKSLMSLYAEYVLTILITFLFLWASWAVRACESYNTNIPMDFSDSMWLIAITFLTVGYGDLVPSSTCGKTIAVLTGIFGVGCSALVVAILAKNLEFSRPQMYVHNFVIGVELSKKMKHAAANVLKEGWLSHKYRKKERIERALKHERRLLQAIREIREIKSEQSKLMDNSLTLIELNRNQITIEKTVKATYKIMQQIQLKLEQCKI